MSEGAAPAGKRGPGQGDARARHRSGVRPRLLVLQHVDVEPLGTLEAPLAQACDIEVLHAYADPLEYARRVDAEMREQGFDGLVVLGGPMAVYDTSGAEFLEDSLRLVRTGIRMDVPMLGICLGSQLIAWTLGAWVRAGRTMGLRKEIGWYPVEFTERGRVDPAFHGFREGQPVFHWHGDTFALPEGAWHLARSREYSMQAFRYGRWIYGIQFHVEVTAKMVADFVSSYQDELAALFYVDGDRLIEQAEKHAPALEQKAQVLGRRFVECIRASRGEEEPSGAV